MGVREKNNYFLPCSIPHTCHLFMAPSEQLPNICPESKSILERGDLPLLSWWILLLDFFNAFSTVIRLHMFCEIHAKVARSVKLCRWNTYCLVTTPCLAAAGSNKGIPSAPYVLQSLFSRLLRDLRGKCLICFAVPSTWTMAHCVALHETLM